MTVAADHKRLQARAAKLARQPADLAARVRVYCDLYDHSGHNHAFALLGAHGAFWARGYLRKGLVAGRLLAWTRPRLRRDRLAALDRFATAFMDINARVCIEAYTSYHLTAAHSDVDALAAFYPRALIADLHACHAARRAGREMSPAAKRALFDHFFAWEQSTVVGQAVKDAMSALNWPLIANIAQRPAIGFRYFPVFKRLWFSAFESAEQRIIQGAKAYDIADQVGWDHVHTTIAPQALQVTVNPLVRKWTLPFCAVSDISVITENNSETPQCT